MTPIVYVYYVRFAEDIQGVVKIFENLIEQGVDEIRATKVDGIYRIEYKIPRED